MILKRHVSLIYIFSLFQVTFLFGQDINVERQSPKNQNYPFQLSTIDSLNLVSLPEIKYKPEFLKTDLPSELNNSTQPYFMPIFEQVSLECGQQSGISYTFNYEWNYRNGTTADILENQFPTHYTFNFMNQGYGWTGVSYLHSFEIAKTNGHPTADDYGGINDGGQSRWMTGYDKYYNGMSNKIEETYQIQVGTPEGLMVLKNWLHNHLNNEDVGGIASFYSDNPWNPTTLPAGTPEGGKHVITYFPLVAGHANTIVGYNDSIRYDYNGDNQYTNHLDINNDGEVNLKDWEIGGFLITEGYNGGVNWADSGFCYMMYKVLAEKNGEGGIWNNCVHVVTIKENYEPLLTMKVKIKHTRREQIRISAAISSPYDASNIMRFPIFNYQGGNQYMQGGNDPDALELELGLDITPLLGKITSGNLSSFFLIVDEHDPQGWGNGSITSFSIIDYSNGFNETICAQQNVPLTNNSQTILTILKSIELDPSSILNETLPTANTGEIYSVQMENQGGAPPYKWEVLRHYDETQQASSFPEIDDMEVNFSDTIHAETLQKIDFEFPFYGNNYDSIWIHTDGFIMFNEQGYPWPYLYDESLMIKTTNNISPMLNRWMYIDEADNDGVWYEGDETYAAFRWKLSCNKSFQTNMSFALILYPSGKIEYYYEQGNTFLFNYWAAGFGSGDNINFKLVESIDISGTQSQKVEFTPSNYPEEMTITDEGIFSGIPVQDYFQVPIDFQVTDHNNISVTKTLEFTSGVASIYDQEQAVQESRIYPNPTNGLFYVEFETEDKTDVVVSLADISGKKLATYSYSSLLPGNHKKQINIEEVIGKNEGVYYIIVEKSGIEPIVSKLVYFCN